MSLRTTAAVRLTADSIELVRGPDDSANLTMLRNGLRMIPGEDYNAGEGDEQNFIQRCGGRPWQPSDHFSATIDE